MSLNEPLDLKSQPKRKRPETERTTKKHAKNKRQKLKRAASPTSSYLSMRTDYSMDPPTNFKSQETFPLHSRIKRERETSPVTGYISMKSDNPMNVSKDIASDLSVKAAWSTDPPTNFKAAETFPLDPRHLTEQDLMCRVCKSMLKDPVSMPCGHNYCNACINAFWDNCAGEYVCPHCGKASETRPVLNINADLAELVKYKQQTGFSPALPQQSYAGPEDVACDFCSGRKLKSVKSCLTCDVFLCETHVRQHYTVPALAKHTLVDVTGDIETRPSEPSQTSDNSFSSTAGGQQPRDIKEMAVAAKLQTRLKRSAKTRPKTKEKKDHVRKIALMCSTLQQEISGLKEKLSELEKKNTKKEYEDEEEYDDEDDDFGKEDDDDDDDDEEDYDDDGDDNEDYSEKDFDAETYEEEEDDEGGLDSFNDEDENKDDWEEDDWEDNEDMEDYDDEDNSEKDSDEDYYADY